MRYLTIIFCAVLVLFSFQQAQAKIIHVPADSSTIQGGINGAVDGDTVLVASDTYYEHINFYGKAILVTSETGAESTIISKLYDGLPIVTFNSDEDTNSILDGFTIQNANNSAGGHSGGGIYCSSSPTIRHNTLKANSTNYCGGGIACDNGGSPIIENNLIVGNYAFHGGAISCLSESSPIISRNLMIGNSVINDGGAIYCINDGTAPTISENLIIENSAGKAGGAIYCFDYSSPTIVANTLDRNISTEWGGSVTLHTSCSPDIRNTIVSNEMSGYGIYAEQSSFPTITFCDVWNNASGDYSGCMPSEGCISADPLFCDTTKGNYHLLPSSPCAGTGQGGADIGAFTAGCSQLVSVTPGPDQSSPANSQVSVNFYVQNLQDFTDSFDLNISDQLGWHIEPTHYDLVLDSGQVDTVNFIISIPNTPVGTIDSVQLDAVSRTDSLAWNLAYLLVTCDAYNVQITHISDVGNDQGKQASIEWLSFPGSDPLVTDFSVFRRKDSLLTSPPATLVAGSGFVPIYPPGEWEWLVTLPAFGETLYSVVVPTLKDSTIAEGIYWSVFFIRAGTDTPTVYFDSPIDSGYSVDNLSPSPPTDLLATHEPAITRLTWAECGDIDFDYYTLYRDTTSEFEPSLDNRLAFAIDTVFLDSTAELGRTYYYLVSATDFSGNESDPSNEAMGVRYITGDTNADGVIDIGDVVHLINYLFIDGPPPTPLQAGDVNCDEIVDIGDVVYLINYLFIGGSPPNC